MSLLSCLIIWVLPNLAQNSRKNNKIFYSLNVSVLGFDSDVQAINAVSPFLKFRKPSSGIINSYLLPEYRRNMGSRILLDDRFKSVRISMEHSENIMNLKVFSKINQLIFQGQSDEYSLSKKKNWKWSSNLIKYLSNWFIKILLYSLVNSCNLRHWIP